MAASGMLVLCLFRFPSPRRYGSIPAWRRGGSFLCRRRFRSVSVRTWVHAKRGGARCRWEVRSRTRWRTSVFPDKRSGTFLLPLKAEVRKKERMLDGDTVRVDLRVVARP